MYRLAMLIAVLSMLASWQVWAETADGQAPAKPLMPRKVDAQLLPNAVYVHEQVISGGSPRGDEAFAELRSLGVKTLISVDGQKPDVIAAAKHGLRYVHLPHGYDGVPRQRVQELAKAVRTFTGPVYIHCHHGKHRSPAAAVAACIAAGLIPQTAGMEILEFAGTSPEYRGLFESVQQVRKLDDKQLDDFSVEFRATVEVPPMAEAMVQLERTHDRLLAIAAADWRTPTDQPDLDPAHETLLLREQFTELLRTEEVKRESDEFQSFFREAENTCRKLETTLRLQPTVIPHSNLTAQLNQITASCKACHQKFRDVPLSEK